MSSPLLFAARLARLPKVPALEDLTGQLHTVAMAADPSQAEFALESWTSAARSRTVSRRRREPPRAARLVLWTPRTQRPRFLVRLVQDEVNGDEYIAPHVTFSYEVLLNVTEP